MPYDKPVDGDYKVIGAGRVPYTVAITIDQDAWDECDDDVQMGVINILDNPPIPLLGIGGQGNGIKQESKGLEFHTQTKKRLQYPGGKIKERAFNFNRYGKGYGH
jgi:hypothetical protein